MWNRGGSGGVCLARLAAALAIWAATGRAVLSGDEPVDLIRGVRMADERSARAVRRAAAGAHRRLGDPACQALLSSFRDPEGRTLRENLDATGETPQSYLARRIFFYEGYRLATCRSLRGRAMAVTSPGSHVIFVCSHRFKDVDEGAPEEAEAVIIHEMLHSLGLGENPPSSIAIQLAVTRSCIRASGP